MDQALHGVTFSFMCKSEKEQLHDMDSHRRKNDIPFGELHMSELLRKITFHLAPLL